MNIIYATKKIPDQWCQAKIIPTHKNGPKRHCKLNFQLYDNDRCTKVSFIKNQRFDVGKNILLNRFYNLNNLIEKRWLDLSLETFKIKCKTMFLENGT